jgi:hypothetical protein
MSKTWEYRGCVIEEDFESWADRAPRIFLKRRTGYLVRTPGEADGPWMPGKYRTLAEAKSAADEELKDGGWLSWRLASIG